MIVFVLLGTAMFLVSKNCTKKSLKMSLIITIALFTLYAVIFSIDYNRVGSLRSPIFVYKIPMNDALPPNIDIPDIREISYQGLGYKVEIKIYRDSQIIQTTMTMFGKVIVAAIT